MTDYKLVPVEGLRYTFDGALAECPCCGSLDVGGAHDTVHCQSCGLTVTKPRPLQNAIDAWNMRTGRSRPAPAVQGEPVGRVKTVGGYPDESEHTIEWLCKYKDLKDGDLLYATPQTRIAKEPTQE